MDIDQARTFLAIAAYGSFLAAAGHLHLTQSTVSARIQRLEDALGARKDWILDPSRSDWGIGTEV